MDSMNRRWYYEVNTHCSMLADKHNVPLIKVAGMMSVLSPNVTFVQNIQSLERYLETGGDCKVSTYSKQKVKADVIYNSCDDITEDEVKAIIGKGLKTRAFFENIYRPETSMAVTVDLWQVRWAKAKRLIPAKGVLTEKRYHIIANSIVRRAKKLGMMPHEYQAITWVEIRGKAF